MGRWSREELEDAFDRYQQAALHSAQSGDWSSWADCFTEDCFYKEHMYGEMAGRAAVLEWITRVMTQEDPGRSMHAFPIEWSIIDTDRGWIVCQVWNRMDDIGDGKVHQEYNFTLLKYAGNGKFSYEEDIYNPMAFGKMLAGWERGKKKVAERDAG